MTARQRRKKRRVARKLHESKPVKVEQGILTTLWSMIKA